MSSGYGPDLSSSGLTLLECHQHHVESCAHRCMHIVLKSKIACKSNANATSRDVIWISSVSSKLIQKHCVRFCYLTLVLVEMHSCLPGIPSDKFLENCQFCCQFKLGLLCSLSIKLHKFFSIWRGLSLYLWLTACMCDGRSATGWNLKPPLWWAADSKICSWWY